MKNLRSPKLYLQVYDELRNYIYENNLRPGSKLPTETEMAAQMGVSRNVLREAIKALEITGVVCSKPGVGIIIQEFNPDHFCNSLVYANVCEPEKLLVQFRNIRRVLELGFSREAFDSITDEDIQMLKQQLAVMRELTEQSHGQTDVTFGLRFTEADAAFHRTLYSRLQMPMLISLLDSFWIMDKNYQSPTDEQFMNFILKKHVWITKALEERDYPAFFRAMEFHYEVAYQDDAPKLPVDLPDVDCERWMEQLDGLKARPDAEQSASLRQQGAV